MRNNKFINFKAHKTMVTVAIGRCNFLTPSQVELINSVDYFILPIGKNNIPYQERLAMIMNYADCIEEQIIVGNPYQELQALKELHPDDLTLVTTSYNSRLGASLGIPVRKIEEPLVNEKSLLRWLRFENWAALISAISDPCWIEDLLEIRNVHYA